MSRFITSVLRKLAAKSFIVSFITIIVLVQLSVFALPALSNSVSKSDTTGPFVATTTDVFPELSFDNPSVITNAGDERLFIVEQAGLIWSVSGSGELATRTLFLDINDRVQDGGERGLLGLAFHPRYEQNGYFYVNYTHLRDGATFSRVSRFQDTAVANRVDAAGEVILLEVRQPYSNHNGGDLHFDPQGMLVIALGDGGSGGDPQNRAQDPQTLLGKLLRIDVDRAEGGKNYAIPADNPFIGQAPLDEIWTLGLRNPWRFSFDRLNGDLYIGDVGQNAWEEVDYVAAAESGGQNFGWRLKEGNVCFNPREGCDPGGLTDPVHVYGHTEGCSVTGGYVYRGEEMRSLNGVYVYADFCSGQIQGLVRNGQGRWQNWTLAQGESSLSTFGENNLGELYFASRGTGLIYRLQAAPQLFLPIVLR